MTVFSTSSPSVGITSGSTVESESSSVASSSPSVAATSLTLADRTAGSVTSATPVSSPMRTRIVPSFSMTYSSTANSMENPSRNPSIASAIASDPAVVFEILKLASIEFSLRVISRVLPIGRVRSCSRLSLTGVGLTDPFAKTTLPVDALAGSSNATIRPLMIRVSESAAVIVIGVVSFIAAYPLLLLFHRRSSRQFR